MIVTSPFKNNGSPVPHNACTYAMQEEHIILFITVK